MKTTNPFRVASYSISINQFEDLPEDNLIEIAFAGRSNAGKSSAINTICDNQNLCRISKTPGRTQMINYFKINTDDEDKRYLVDLPGYGYAKVPMQTKLHWQNMLERYLVERQSLKGLVMIMDVRRPMTEHDQMMMDWCLDCEMPVHVLLTKADKLKSGAAKNALLKLTRELQKNYPIATVQLFSSLKKTGLNEAIDKILQWLN